MKRLIALFAEKILIKTGFSTMFVKVRFIKIVPILKELMFLY